MMTFLCPVLKRRSNYYRTTTQVDDDLNRETIKQNTSPVKPVNIGKEEEQKLHLKRHNDKSAGK